MRLTLIALFGAIALASCNSEPKPVDHHAEMSARIDSLEAVLKAADGDLDTLLAEHMVQAYKDFQKGFPEDSMNVYYAYRAGEISRNTPGKELYAVGYYADVHEQYPNHELAPMAVFMTGVSFDQMGDKQRAAKSFNYFIETYPEHPWVDQAREMLVLTSDTVDLETEVSNWLNKAK
ncbi:MAG: tetratricopeptide repeat protein [Flavobacteriia bacterium]|nr:tetratricopeptide repeat protein [Flavobacteriia bacterium]